MAVPNIQVTYTEASLTVAHYLGYLPADGVLADMDAAQAADVLRCVQMGFRQACYPPILEKEDEQYEWTFLLRHQAISLNSATYYAPNNETSLLAQSLISDFDGVIRRASLRGNSDGNPLTESIELRVVSHGQITQIESEDPQATGIPKYIAAVRLTESSADVYEYADNGGVYRIALWPPPANPVMTVYVLNLDYPIAPALWSSTDLYPPGGPKHGRMFLQACLAEAELLKNDGNRTHYDRFIEYLKHSVAIDRREKSDYERAHNWSLTEVAPDTLDVTYTDLLREVGAVAGWGLNPTMYDHEKRNMADYVVRRGYQRFCKANGHAWSFLVQETDFATSTSAGSDFLDLPENFSGQILDPYIYAIDEERRSFRISVIPMERLRAIQARVSTVPQGIPKYVAIVPVTPPDSPQFWRASFHPTPDGEYDMAARMLIVPNPLSATNRYPLGAAAHGETISQAVRAAAEQYINRTANGPEEQKYLACLQASIELDKQAMATTQKGTWPNELEIDVDETSPATSSAPGYNFLTLKRDVGIQMGLGANPNEWTHAENGMVESYVHEGYRDFIYPVILPQIQRQNYVWRFLTKRQMVVVTPPEDTGFGGSEESAAAWIEAHSYAMPADFGGNIDDLDFAYANTNNGCDLKHVPEHYVRRLRANNSGRSGPPQMYFFLENMTQSVEINAVGNATLTNTQTKRYFFWPFADQTYYLEHVYAVDPYPLSGDTCVPLGSPNHANTILALCLAAVEQRHQKITNGPMTQKAMRLLEASVKRDMTSTGPTFYGRNTNAMFDPMRGTRLQHSDYAVATLNGEEL